MINLYDRVQPVAGPSTRRPRSASSTLGDSPCALGAECPLLPDVVPLAIQGRTYRPIRRQDPASSSVSPSTETSSATSTSGLFPVPPSTSSVSSSDLFPIPTSTVNSETSSIANSTFSQESSTNYAYTPSSHSSHVYSSATSSFSQPWHTSARTPTPQVSQHVEGILLPMQLSGDTEDQAVYSVPMSFGHDADGSDNGNQRRSYGNLRYKRGPSVDWQPGQPQILNLQVDLGSSDMWVASDTCTTSDCRTAPNLFNASESLDSGFETDFQYHRGEVSGNVYWEQIQLGGFGIGYQAFLAADEVSNENLAGGNFSGVLGLALPANSIILSDIAGSTTGNPDGATFLDNLFGSGLSAPSDKLFSLSLARREDVRTASSFGIGAISKALCPQPCNPTYIPIVSQPSLGAVGYLHWRIPLQGIIATTWADQRAGLGASQRNITLGSSQTSSGGSTPLAVLDSGGVQILVGHQPWVDAIYGAYGVQASSDGNYRMPCTTQLALSFVFGGKEYAVHPLDLSWPDPADPSQATCIGAIQYTSTLGQTGDFVLGSSFLKNVYSVFQYPDNDRRNGRIWQPTVGMVSLTNASVASQDFYAVRVQRQSLADVSANHPSGVENHPGDSGSETSGSNSPTEAPTSGKLLSTAGVAGISVLAFIVVAAGLFCAWWFWLRRKFGKQGVVVYPASKRRSKSSGNHSDTGTSSLRNRKHDATSRQKSMMEGFSDHEADSWMSTTEGDSIRLGYMPEVLGEEDDRNHGGMPESSRASSYRDTSADRKSVRDIRSSQAEAEGGDHVDHSTPPVLAAVAPTKARQSSPDVGTSRSRSSLAIPDSPSRYPAAYPYPTQGQIPSHTPRAQSLSMSGPFPSANASRLSSLRPEASPMYDISTADYFAVPSVGSPRGRQARRLSPLPPSAKDTDVPAGESTLTGGPLAGEPDEAKKEARPLDPFTG